MKYIIASIASLIFISVHGQDSIVLDCREKIIFNARIFTANKAHPFADAVAIVDDKIIAVGNLSQVKKIATANTEMIDMHGGFILPGFIDSHCHALAGGTDLMHANINDAISSVPQIVAYARKVWKDSSGRIGNYLVINGLNISTWTHLDELSAAFNAEEFVTRPLLLNGSDGHTHWGNHAMMNAAGLNQQFIQRLAPVTRKYYGIDTQGSPNGFVADSGFNKYSSVMPPAQDNLNQAAGKAMKYMSEIGITAWLDPAAGDTKDSINAYVEEYAILDRKDLLHAHVSAIVVADADRDPSSQITKVKTLQRNNIGKDFQVIGFKIFADGVVEYPTQTAAMSKPYKNNGSKGPLMFQPDSFARFVTAADRANLLVHVHAIGDRAVTETLKGFGAMRAANGMSAIPHTITHLQFVQPTDIPLFKKLDVLASVQLMWAFGDVTTIDIVKPYIDSSIYRWQYPARSLVNAGATLCGASDWPVSSANPFEAIYEAETRRGTMGVLDSTQCVSRMAMLYAYTINAARALRMEAVIGSIEPGKFADLILCDRNVTTVSADEMHNAKILWTMFKGKLVYVAGQ